MWGARWEQVSLLGDWQKWHGCPGLWLILSVKSFSGLAFWGVMLDWALNWRLSPKVEQTSATGASLVAQTVKCLPAMQETQVQFLGWEDSLEKEMAIHSSTLPWKIPWTEDPDRLQSMGSQRVGHDWATSLSFTLRLNKPSGIVPTCFGNTKVLWSLEQIWEQLYIDPS